MYEFWKIGFKNYLYIFVSNSSRFLYIFFPYSDFRDGESSSVAGSNFPKSCSVGSALLLLILFNKHFSLFSLTFLNVVVINNDKVTICPGVYNTKSEQAEQVEIFKDFHPIFSISKFWNFHFNGNLKILKDRHKKVWLLSQVTKEVHEPL